MSLPGIVFNILLCTILLSARPANGLNKTKENKDIEPKSGVTLVKANVTDSGKSENVSEVGIHEKAEDILRNIFDDFTDEQRSDIELIQSGERQGRNFPAPGGNSSSSARAKSDQKPNRRKNPNRVKPDKSKNRPRPSSESKSTAAQRLGKYNEYMDAVLGRMNILIKKKRMDPLRVNLYTGGGGGKKGKKKENKNKPKGKMDMEQVETEESEANAERDIEIEVEKENQRQTRSILPNASSDAWDYVDVEEGQEEGRSSDKKIQPKTNRTRKGGKKSSRARPTRGILHGLSTLRRDGNVQVIKDGHRAKVVRAKFLLGPVALEILPKKSKKTASAASGESETKTEALTATAPQLKGLIEIRLSPVSPTRIKKLKVYPPGNKVQVNSGGVAAANKSNYRTIQPHATARLRQAAVEVVRQVDHKMKVH